MVDEQMELLELDVWSALRRVEEAFERLASQRAADARRPELQLEYSRVRASLDAPVVALRTALERALPEPRAMPGESYAHRVFAALLICYDERELAGASGPAGAGAHELLQTQHAGLYDGGEHFFVQLERVLRAPAPPSLVLQLFLFCLRGGFCGRYPRVDDPERLAYQDELSRRVGKRPANELDASAVAAPHERIAGAGFPYLAYVAGACVLVLGWLGLNSMADAHQTTRTGSRTCITR